MSPTLLFTFFIIAFTCMVISIGCLFILFNMARKIFFKIYENDKNLYELLVGKNNISWIERKVYSIKDFSLWWKIYSLFYSSKKIETKVILDEKNKFVFISRIMFTCLFLSVFIAVVVMVIGASLYVKQT